MKILSSDQANKEKMYHQDHKITETCGNAKEKKKRKKERERNSNLGRRLKRDNGNGKQEQKFQRNRVFAQNQEKGKDKFDNQSENK